MHCNVSELKIDDANQKQIECCDEKIRGKNCKILTLSFKLSLESYHFKLVPFFSFEEFTTKLKFNFPSA